jgi:hypothetical protein
LDKQVSNVSVQVVQAAFRDSIGHVVNGTRHVRKCSLLRARVSSLGRELGEQSNLEVVKVLVVPGKLPSAAVFQNGFDDEPILFLSETVAGNAGRDRRKQLGI